jgi:N-methylhydantoinase B/oxoprolinase/acetone carboxylase alpha subunit
LFAPDGDLVANAPFIPIHLGSMSLCVSCFLPHPVPIEL